MVTITDGNNTFRIPAGAVEPYKGMGFHVMSNIEAEEIKHAIQEHYKDFDEQIQDDMSIKDKNFVEELIEKPLSQWSNDEVKDFVRIKGIDTSGAQKVSQVRGIIKTYLEEQNK